MVMRARGDLRQVRDREDLMVLRDAAQRIANLKANASTDARVNLVEDEGGNPIESRENGL
jgi:hypothetical protein